MAPLKPCVATQRSSSSAAASGTAVGSAAKAAKRFGLAAQTLARRSLTPRGQLDRDVGGQLLGRGRAVRKHLHVDANLVHFLQPPAAEIVEPLFGLAAARALGAVVVLDQLRVPVVLFDGDDRTVRLLHHDASPLSHTKVARVS